MNLNRAYAGLGRTTWTVYAIQASASDDVIKESFPDGGISMSTKYTMTAKFKQGEIVYFGAYTDVTAKSWRTDDYTTLLEYAAANPVQMPEKPTDPKANAEVINFTGAPILSEKKDVTFREGRYHYVKLVLEQDAMITITKCEGSGIVNAPLGDNTVYNTHFADGEKEPIHNDGGSLINHPFLLTKGTHWLRFTFYWYSDSNAQALRLDYAFSVEPYIPATGITWTSAEYPDLAAVAIPAGQELHMTATVDPANASAEFVKLTSGNYIDDVRDVALSADGRTLTFTTNNGAGGNIKTLTASVKNKLDVGGTAYSISLASPPNKLDLTYAKIEVESTSIFVESNRADYGIKNLYVRAWVKGPKDKKWVKKLDEDAMPGNGADRHYIKGLKPNTAYQVKYIYYVKIGDVESPSAATKFKVKTGAKKAPSIKSVKISNKKKVFNGYIDAHWERNGSILKWVPRKKSYSYSYTLTVTLKSKAPSGVLGLRYGDKNVAGKGKTKYVFKLKTGTVPKKGVFTFYSDKTYGGYSPTSKSVKFK